MNGQYPLPEGWRWVRLGDVCTQTEKRDPRESADMPFQYVDISSVDSLYKQIISARKIWGKDSPSRARQVIKANDVIVATTRPNLNAVALVPEELDNEICSTGFCVLRPTGHIHPSFLLSFVQTQYFVETISGQVRGMLYPAVTDIQIRDMYMPLPSLPEQKRIAAKIQELMQEVERARASCEKQLEAAKALPAAYLREVFESEEAKQWEMKRLGEVCKFEYGTGLPQPERVTGKIPVLGSNGIVGYHNSPITQGPTIVIGRKGSIGQVNYSEVPCWPIDTTYYIDSSKTPSDLAWLYWALKWLRLDLLNKATGVPGLNREDAYMQTIPMPPAPKQKLMGTKLKDKITKAEKLELQIEMQQEAINALPQALLGKAFRGEL